MSNRVPFWSDKDKTRTSSRVPFRGDKDNTRTLPTIIPDLDGKSDQIETLAAASEETLEALMLTKMNMANNLRKDIALLIGELTDQLADAKLAELLLAGRRKRENGQ